MNRLTCITMGMSLLSLLACQSDAAKRPAQPQLPQVRMETIMYDLHIVDAWVDRQGGPSLRRQEMRDDMYDEVLDKHDLTRRQFHQAYQYYLDHPVALDTLYSRVQRRLKTELDSIRTEETRETLPPKSRAPNLER